MFRKTAAHLILVGSALLSAQGQQDQKNPLVRGPYLQNVTTTSIVVCFQTHDLVIGTVEYGDGERLSEKVVGPDKRQHAIELKGLKPATRYHYRAHGATGSFVTAPDGDTPFTFVVYGDCRTGHDAHAKIAAGVAKASPAFVVITGDLVERGSRTELWTKFFEITADVFKDAPLYPALGNHEDNASEYYDIFALPGNKEWYSFDYGAAHFTVLDMTAEHRNDEKQIAWAKEDLSKTKAAVKFVAYHHPAFSASRKPDRMRDAETIYATWGPIFEKHKVTAAFQGHNHNYQRAEKNGITYITTAGGGAPIYDPGPKLPETQFAKVAYHFIMVSVEAKKIVCRAIDAEGNELETFALAR